MDSFYKEEALTSTVESVSRGKFTSNKSYIHSNRTTTGYYSCNGVECNKILKKAEEYLKEKCKEEER